MRRGCHKERRFYPAGAYEGAQRASMSVEADEKVLVVVLVPLARQDPGCPWQISRRARTCIHAA